jgi:EpsI family protein
MGVMTYHYGESMLHGPLHVFQGLFASQAGILFLFLANWGATKLPSDRTLTLHRRWKGAAIPIAPARRVTRTIGPPVVLVSSFLLLVACYIHFFASPQPVPLKQPLSDLPYAIDGWRARDSEWIEGSRFFPGATAEIRRTYHAGEKTVFLYVGYFASQRQGGSLITVHATPIAQNAREVPLPQNLPGLHRVNHSAPTLDGKRYEALFWYHSSSGKTLGRYETKLRQILGAVLHGRNNGAVVLLAAPASGPDRPTRIEDLMTFSTVLAPVLDRYLP